MCSTRVRELVEAQEAVLLGRLLPSLADEGVSIVDWADLDVRRPQGAHRDLRATGASRAHAVGVRPRPSVPVHLQPLAQPGGDRRRSRHRRATLRPGQGPLVPAEVLRAAGRVAVHRRRGGDRGAPHRLFPGMAITETSAFRVTRNADLSLDDDDADDLLAAVEVELRRRRFGKAVRLEVSHRMSAGMISLLLDELDLDADELTTHRRCSTCSGLFDLHGADRPELQGRRPGRSVTARPRSPPPRQRARPIFRRHAPTRRARPPPVREFAD